MQVIAERDDADTQAVEHLGFLLHSALQIAMEPQSVRFHHVERAFHAARCIDTEHEVDIIGHFVIV